MNSQEFVLSVLRDLGKQSAKNFQTESVDMTGTEINASDTKIPEFKMACKTMNMLKRKAGQKDGFVCKSSAGRVVRLIQNYDSDIYTGEPEELPAQWRFVWSTDPTKALPFMKFATSPFGKGDCCQFKNDIYRSTIDNNVYSPDEYPQGWEVV